MRAMYTPSTFLRLLKQDIGIKDIPLPVDDNELLNHFYESALREFSVRYPRIEHILMSEEDRLEGETLNPRIPLMYRIPKRITMQATVLGVPYLIPARPQGFADAYVPDGMWADPSSVLMAVSDIQVAASTAANMGKAPTHEFRSPDMIYIYNGWMNAIYWVDVALMHDTSLITIPPTAFTDLRRLAILDMQAYLYNQLKRVDNTEVGIGSINLKIDDWAGSRQDMTELLRDWDENGSNLDFEGIVFY